MEPDAPQQSYRTRLDVLFAAEARRAVILRRGPRTHYRLIAWDLKTDTFTCGQWMKGLVRLHDLSPDGRMLIYWAAQYHSSAVERRLRVRARGGAAALGAGYDPIKVTSSKSARKLVRRGRKVPRYLRAAAGLPTSPSAPHPQPNTGTWTAISPVPYFSALAIWPAFGHWTGGGVFMGNAHIVIMEPENRMTPVAHVPVPQRMTIQSAQSVPGAQQGLLRSARRPDLAINVHDRWRPLELQAECDRYEASLKAQGLRMVEWVHGVGEDAVFAADGTVYRVPGGKGLPPENYLAAARKLIDLTPMRFELVQAPAEAMHW